ncbi:hypothetical protein CONPUDRAFT_138151 [Coniophora puteana RWD-64-598 SS2]|uniref:Uncharacterized protein n=1 Tax=Coniophora puteana (strain RWD-64-598) TaxID=741705 RepID=A0A5M3MHV1_CONPW|nr:uncharacterized protein CONPUDRAFT_138151 [Coniophora puteana RWD-64-598 SS2]EIW78782.1 hypothetical protein CONPUDRAFT_138151 [Coniophora puteana RWD-64-598 SS2]
MPGFPANAHATFRVPLDDAEALYVFSRGKNQDGWLRIVHEDRLVDGYAEVVVEASYEHEGVLDSSSVCYLEREAGERGVGLMTPDGWSSEPHGTVWFQVKVALPAGVEVRRLEAHMSNYAITVEDTRDTIVFDDVDLKTSNFGIDVKSLNASRASLRSSNGPIKGRFAARQLLDLHTSNAEINVLVDLFNEDGESATEYRARTINGYLHSFINLARFADAPSSGGSYSIDTRTSNGGLALNFGSSPVDSHLDVVAWTSNAPASVVLHPAFEGRYHADTSNAGATLMRTNTKDPSGKGRERVIREDVGLRQTEVGGVVFWDDEDSSDKADKGSVRVSSSNKLVTLVI